MLASFSPQFLFGGLEDINNYIGLQMVTSYVQFQNGI